jgi:hypothetical protein
VTHNNAGRDIDFGFFLCDLSANCNDFLRSRHPLDGVFCFSRLSLEAQEVFMMVYSRLYWFTYRALMILLVVSFTLASPLTGLSQARASAAVRLHQDVSTSLALAQAFDTLPVLPGWSETFTSQLFMASSDPLMIAQANPLIVVREQSAYQASGSISNTLVITFTVTNHQLPAALPYIPASATLTDTVAALGSIATPADANTLHNVLLADTLASGVTFVSASQPPDRKTSPPASLSQGERSMLAFNLGDIAPTQSAQVVLTLRVGTVTASANIDGGATAWGTQGTNVVKAQACPITLVAATVGGEAAAPYLQTNAETDFSDSTVSRLAAQTCSPGAAFDAVRALGYEAYKGSLRGARGTLWSGAGNSLDKTSLLIATLRANGTPARYRHGTLSDAQASELILSMFPTTGGVVGYVPDGTPVSDPTNDAGLLAEARDHWWAEAWQDGTWVAYDPTFSYATPGQTFAAAQGGSLTQIPAAMRHKVRFTLRVEQFNMLGYLNDGFIYTDTLTYEFPTAELVGQPVTLKHLVNAQRPPMGCMVFCWVHYSYAPYLRVGDSPQVVMGHQYWELLSNFPLGQFAITGEWLILDLVDADGQVQTFTRTIADRVGIDQRESDHKIGNRLIPELMGGDVMNRFGPYTPSLVNEMDNYTFYFNPSWMSPEYAAHVGENLLAAAPRMLEAQQVGGGLELIDKVMAGQALDASGRMKLTETAEMVEDTVQALNRMLGATFVVASDDASRELGVTGLVKAYADSPRILVAATVISPTSQVAGVTVVSLDLLHDNLRAIAYPGQAKGAEQVFRLTRGMNDTFLEDVVGTRFLGAGGQGSAGEGEMVVKSAAGVLRAAAAQDIALTYVDMDHLQNLKEAKISEKAKARILMAAKQGYGVLVPKQMVTMNGAPAIAWWQVDPKTGETIGVGEDGTHQVIVILAVAIPIVVIALSIIAIFVMRFNVWKNAANDTWNYFWETAANQTMINNPNMTQQQIYLQALKDTKKYMQDDTLQGGWGQFKARWDNDWPDWLPADLMK